MTPSRSQTQVPCLVLARAWCRTCIEPHDCNSMFLREAAAAMSERDSTQAGSSGTRPSPATREMSVLTVVTLDVVHQMRALGRLLSAVALDVDRARLPRGPAMVALRDWPALPVDVLERSIWLIATAELAVGRSSGLRAVVRGRCFHTQDLGGECRSADGKLCLPACRLAAAVFWTTIKDTYQCGGSCSPGVLGHTRRTRTFLRR